MSSIERPSKCRSVNAARSTGFSSSSAAAIAASALLGGELRLNLRAAYRRTGRRADDTAADRRRSGAQLRPPAPACASLAAILCTACTARAAATAGVGTSLTTPLTARRVRPGLPLAEQRRLGNCRDDNKEEGETNREVHALLT